MKPIRQQSKRGRPVRSESKSTKYIKLRATEDERDRLNVIASRHGMTTSEYLRSLIPDKVIA